MCIPLFRLLCRGITQAVAGMVKVVQYMRALWRQATAILPSFDKKKKLLAVTGRLGMVSYLLVLYQLSITLINRSLSQSQTSV